MPLEFDKKPNFIIIVFYVDHFEYTRVMNESYPTYIAANTTWINKIRDEGFTFLLSYCGRPKRATGGYPSKWHLLSETNPFCGTDGTAARTEFYYNNCTNRLNQDGFDFLDKLCVSNIDQTNGVNSHNAEWMTDVYVSIKFMNDCINNNNESFFLYIALTYTHSPDRYDSAFNFDMSATPTGIYISTTPSGEPDKHMYHMVKAANENGICFGIHYTSTKQLNNEGTLGELSPKLTESSELDKDVSPLTNAVYGNYFTISITIPLNFDGLGNASYHEMIRLFDPHPSSVDPYNDIEVSSNCVNQVNGIHTIVWW